MALIGKWLIFRQLNKSFLSNIRFVSVFGTDGNEALFVTKDDDVFAFGSNRSSYLGLGNTDGFLEPQKISSLCKKGIIKFAHGSGHTIALSIDGNIYTWGNNNKNQLGNGNTNAVSTPLQISSIGKKIVDIACGSHHTLVLTDDRKVYGWGLNILGQIDSGSTNNLCIPIKVKVGLVTEKIKAIACGQDTSMAVLETGEVLCWGYNLSGMLGTNTNLFKNPPSLVENLNGVDILKAVSGIAHTLLLSDEGNIYAMGDNAYGQLGNGNQNPQKSAINIITNFGPFIDIGASIYANISAAVSKNGKCYMWGLCKGKPVLLPTETGYLSIHDIFALFATPAVTYTTVEFGNAICKATTNKNVILDSISNAFNDKTNSDFKFIVERREIYVHIAILRIRCEHFRSMFSSHWEESSKEELEITQYSYEVYYSFLQYLYTNEVNIATEYVFDLLDLANAYCETHLKTECELITRNKVSIDNAAMIYSFAIKLNAKELEEYCFKFALKHLTSVVQTKAFTDLDKEIITSFLMKAAITGAFKRY